MVTVGAAVGRSGSLPNVRPALGDHVTGPGPLTVPCSTTWPPSKMVWFGPALTVTTGLMAVATVLDVAVAGWPQAVVVFSTKLTTWPLRRVLLVKVVADWPATAVPSTSHWYCTPVPVLADWLMLYVTVVPAQTGPAGSAEMLTVGAG